MPTKIMHKAWKEDCPETYAAIFKADYAETLIGNIVTDTVEN